jgi:LmbE family N-acetylglucosaminyl deacetylase
VDVLYVSPHPDDVAFSAAARLARDVAAGRRAAVLTLFAPGPGTASQALGDATARAAEDQRFSELAGVERLDGGFTDAIARRPRYRAPRHLFGPLAADEEPLVEEVRARLQAYVDAGCGRVVAPLGVGQHVDHQVAHAAARRLRDADVLFYEDTPYVITPFQLARRLDRLQLSPVGAQTEADEKKHDRTILRGGVGAELGAAARAWLDAPLLRELAKPPHHVLALGSILFQSELLHWPRRARQPQARIAPDVVEGPDVSERKLAAIACYQSQWRLFFPSLDDWRAAFERYAERMGQGGVVERAWWIL